MLITKNSDWHQVTMSATYKYVNSSPSNSTLSKSRAGSCFLFILYSLKISSSPSSGLFLYIGLSSDRFQIMEWPTKVSECKLNEKNKVMESAMLSLCWLWNLPTIFTNLWLESLSFPLNSESVTTVDVMIGQFVYRFEKTTIILHLGYL